MSPPKRSLEAYVEDTTKARFAENQEIARTARAAAATAREQAEELTDLKRRLGLYERLEAARLEPPTWLTPKAPSKPHVAIPSLVISDWHWGETVDAAQVDYINAYNVRIAESRMRKAFEGALKITRDYFKGVQYEGFQVFLAGDILSGNIHDLRETNEGTIFEHVLGASESLAAGLALLARDMGPVHVIAVVGNHTRMTVKPINKNRTKDSFDWLVYRMVERQLQGLKGITMSVSEAADARVQIYNTRYLLTHGDEFVGGSGISAELAPLLLGVHRRMKREVEAGHPFDVMICGHFHRHLSLSGMGLIVNGSGVGYNERGYQRSYTPQPAQCALWLTAPEHGVTVSAPVFVANRKAEGW